MKNGVPFDVAHCMEEQELLAWAIVAGQYENGNKEWDWDNMRFVEKPGG